MAELSDTIHPFLATSVTHDDNLLRLDDNQSGQNGARADTAKQVEGGLLFERPFGRQVLSGHAKLSRVTFENFRQLDYDGRDLEAVLAWQLGNHVSGHLGATDVQTLTPFTDFHSDERNLRVQKRNYIDGTWRFHPSWQVRGGFKRDKYTYDLTAQRFNNRNDDATEFGVDYLATSSSKIGLVLRRLKGDYTQQQVIGTTRVDNGYVQNEAKANIYWAISGTSQLIFVGGLVQRKHASNFAFRDDNGTNGRLIANWAPLGKVRFNVMGWREYGAAETNFVNSSLTTGLSGGVSWDVSAKVTLDAQLRHENREFKPLIGVTSLTDLTDTARSASAGITYQPMPKIQLGVNAFHDQRSGSVGAGTNAYKANGISLKASGQF